MKAAIFGHSIQHPIEVMVVYEVDYQALTLRFIAAHKEHDTVASLTDVWVLNGMLINI